MRKGKFSRRHRGKELIRVCCRLKVSGKPTTASAKIRQHVRAAHVLRAHRLKGRLARGVPPDEGGCVLMDEDEEVFVYVVVYTRRSHANGMYEIAFPLFRFSSFVV